MKNLFESATNEPTKEQMHSIYRGIWADKLVDGQELPLGGSLFSEELTTKLKLDFSKFDNQLARFTPENIQNAYDQSKENVQAWLKKTGSEIHPYTYFLCYQVQQKMHALLEVDPKNPVKSSDRQKVYSDNTTPKLSDLIGKTECAEQAALGQYLLQKAGVQSAYMSGITMKDAMDNEEFPADHSFLVLPDPADQSTTLIFDIARPRSQEAIPRVLKADSPVSYTSFKEKTDLLIGATEVLQGGKLYFGVGKPVAGNHTLLNS